MTKSSLSLLLCVVLDSEHKDAWGLQPEADFQKCTVTAEGLVNRLSCLQEKNVPHGLFDTGTDLNSDHIMVTIQETI